MTRRFAIMGFTEAELGFILAAAFAALGISSLNRQRGMVTAEQFRHEQHARVTAEKALQFLRDSLHKKSNKTAGCQEKGESAEPIADLSVIASDLYLIGSDSLSFAEIRARLAPQIARSQVLHCHYRIIVRARQGVDSPIFAAASRPLWQFFDVLTRP